MTPESQRIAIAEVCGWEFRRQFVNARGEPTKEWTKAGIGSACVWDLPDYLNDLNAMHEAEKVLTEDQYDRYCYNVLMGENSMNLATPEAICATAAQRAEAFLRTLGLWKD